MDQVIALLEYLGITPSQLLPALIIGGVYLYIVKRWFSADVRSIKEGIQSMNKEVAIMKDEIRDLHNATRELQLHLANDSEFAAQHSLDQKPLFEQYGQHGSPMQPNPKGRKLLEESHFYDMYEQLKPLVFEQMDKMNLRTLYDYESGASRALFLLSNDPAMDQIKEYVVNNPSLSLELIFGIASWIIRDDYAEYVQESGDKTES